MDAAERERIAALQARIDEALREPEGDAFAPAFSEYMPGATVPLQDALLAAAATGGVGGLEALLDTFDRLRPSTSPGALRHALSIVLTHHPAFAELGLRLPSLEERSPWKVWPGKRDHRHGG